MVKLNDIVKEKIIFLTSNVDFKNGMLFSEEEVILRDKQEYVDGTLSCIFNVSSSRGRGYVLSKISTRNDNVIDTFCTCPRHRMKGSCEHIAAALIHYKDIFFTEKSNEEIIEISNDFFKKYLVSNEPKIKKQVFVEYKISNQYMWDDEFYVSIKIGFNKKYSLSSKLRMFLDSYIEGYTYVLGKEFTYSPDTCFFSEDDEKLLDFIRDNMVYSGNKGIAVRKHRLREFFKLLKGVPFTYNDNVINEIKEESPFEMVLSKKHNNYVFEVNTKIDGLELITYDGEYYYKDNIIYHSPKKVLNLIDDMKEKRMNKLMFEEKDLNSFSMAILPIVKKELVIDSSVDNVSIVLEIGTKMYFDFNDDDITCNLKFVYNDKVIDYFDNNSGVLRDINFEQNVIQDLVSYNFFVGNNKIVLEDIDYIGNFFENGLDELSKKYEVFTSEKMQYVNVKKNNRVSSNFSLGQDNIMHYEFKIDNINDDEIDDILMSLKKKKKYFKLKSGDILSLDNNGLIELSNLTDELNMDYKELKNSGGELPKYYALYLDSLKKNRYSIIKTNNLFDDFISDFKKYQSVDIEFDKFERKTLRDYQFDGVKWLYTIHKCNFGGILADEMGLGKSLQTICLIKKILKEYKDSKFLIVVPTSLIYNWKNEFNKFGSEISIELLSGTKEKREQILNEFKSSVYVTTYGILREDIDLYEDKFFKVCIIDEAQNIKNPKAGITRAVKKIKSQTRFALTGTPIENGVLELWSIFDFIMSGFLSSMVKFQEKYKINEFNDKTNSLIERLHSQIKPFILRRKKVDVAKDLPEKIENNVYIDLSEKEMKLYMAEVSRVKKEMDNAIKAEGFSKARFEILKLITRLRQICIDPKIVYDNFNLTSSKIENLLKVVKEVVDNGHKILLFTSFKTALGIVRNEFDKCGITSYTIDGSVNSKNRMDLVNKFNSDNTNVFLIMLKSGGTGLNLTSADVVIHLDLWWNPQAENQATDRTHRIGQTKTVEVIKLVARGTIEEKILELQKKKQLLSDKLIESDNPDAEIFNKLTEEDIRDLLAFENKQ